MATGYTAPFFIQRFFEPNGDPLSGGKAYFYVAGSTSLQKNVYADIELTLPLTQPLICDASGTLPQYFMEDGQYKIVIFNSANLERHSRDHIEGAGSGSGGAGGDAFTVKATPTDTAPASLIEKIQSTQTLVWNSATFSGTQKVFADVNIENVLDGKVKTDINDLRGYLGTKFENGHYIDWSLNLSTHKIKFDFVGPDYVPKTGGTYTGPVTIPTLTSTTINTTDLNVSNNLSVLGLTTLTSLTAYNATIGNAVVNTLRLTGATGIPAPVLSVDPIGNVIVVDGLHKVKVSGTDTKAQYLGEKLLPGTGIQFTTVTDTDGQHIAISTQTPPRLDMYKVANGLASARTYNTTPKDFWTQVGVQVYGSLVIPGGTIKPGTRLRMVHKILNATAAFNMVISQTGTGTGSSMTIAVPAGTSHVEIDYQYSSTFGDVYQNRESFYQIINTTNPCTGVVPSDGNGLDITANMAFTISCSTATGSTTVGLHDLTLWVIP